MTMMLRRHCAAAIRPFRPTIRFASTQSLIYDVLIVGGGVVGSGLTRLLKKSMPRLSVGLIERGGGPSTTTYEEDAIPNAKCYALSPKSLQILDLPKSKMMLQPAYYDTMQIWEQDSPSVLVFSEQDLTTADYLGAVVEDAPLVHALWNDLRESSSTDCFTHRQVSSLDVSDEEDVVRVTISKDKDDDGESDKIMTLSTRLLVAADGSNSWIRKECGIPFPGFDYERMALTCTVEIPDATMRGRAFQRFLPNGPLALLPSRSKTHATIVWSTTPEEALEYKNSKRDSDLVDKVNEILQQGPQRIPPLLPQVNDGILANLAYGIERMVDTVQYGLTMAHWNDHEEIFFVPPRIKALAGPKLTFPLQCRHASSSYLYKNKVVLVGDAAHAIHPMAGQGLNLGLSDVEALADCIQRAYDSGMDIRTFLSDYDTTQRAKNTIRINGIHALHEIFGNHLPMVQHAKSLGMHAVNHVGPIRRQLAAAATGAI